MHSPKSKLLIVVDALSVDELLSRLVSIGSSTIKLLQIVVVFVVDLQLWRATLEDGGGANVAFLRSRGVQISTPVWISTYAARTLLSTRYPASVMLFSVVLGGRQTEE